MDVRPEELVQGTPKNRVFNIGGIEEDISLEAPVLIGGGANIDGRNLLIGQIANALLPTGATFPLLENATMSISAQGGAHCSIRMISDGGPEGAEAFTIYPNVPDGFTDDLGHNFGHNVPSYRLDPTITAGGQTPTRVATFYDFRVNLAGYFFYVMDCNVQVNVGVEKLFFLGGAGNDPLRGGPDPFTSDEMATYNWGTQRPWIGVKSIAVSGSGTAAVLLEDLQGDYNFFASDYGTNYQPPEDSVNVEMKEIINELTLQSPGVTNSAPSTFTIEIWDPVGATWRSVFAPIGDPTNPIVDLSKSIVSGADFKVSPGVLTVNFQFHCWVK
jgi:hypothetical protein